MRVAKPMWAKEAETVVSMECSPFRALDYYIPTSDLSCGFTWGHAKREDVFSKLTVANPIFVLVFTAQIFPAYLPTNV